MSENENEIDCAVSCGYYDGDDDGFYIDDYDQYETKVYPMDNNSSDNLEATEE
jgi:hypothetical protein